MQALNEEMETIHLYVVREKPKKPYTAFPLFCALLCLLGIIALTLYSAEHPYYEHERITVPAKFLPLKVFIAEAPIIPTGVKTYPATYAHGFLTFSNGSVIGQSVPVSFTIDNVSTNYPVYVPPATPDGFGVARVSAHLLIASTNLSTLAINEVIGASLFVRNLSPFIGGRPAYSVTYQLPKDRQAAIDIARALVVSQKAQIHATLANPCSEGFLLASIKTTVTWRCQFATFKVPSYMHVSGAKLSGKNFLVDVSFVPLPKTVWFR